MNFIEITNPGGGSCLVSSTALAAIHRLPGPRWRIEFSDGRDPMVCADEPASLETFPAQPGVLLLEAFQTDEGQEGWGWTSAQVVGWRCLIEVASGLTIKVMPIVDAPQYDLKDQVLVDTTGRRARLVGDDVWSDDLLAVLADSVGAKRLELLSDVDVWSGADSIRARRSA